MGIKLKAFYVETALEPVRKPETQVGIKPMTTKFLTFIVHKCNQLNYAAAIAVVVAVVVVVATLYCSN